MKKIKRGDFVIIKSTYHDKDMLITTQTKMLVCEIDKYGVGELIIKDKSASGYLYSVEIPIDRLKIITNK